MQVYVNYYTRERMNLGDIPPIGIMLCAEEDDAVVQYTLPEDNQQIFEAKNMPYLSSKEELKRELNLDGFKKKPEQWFPMPGIPVSATAESRFPLHRTEGVIRAGIFIWRFCDEYTSEVRWARIFLGLRWV